jgi:hypothetical protein
VDLRYRSQEHPQETTGGIRDGMQLGIHPPLVRPISSKTTVIGTVGKVC